MGTVTVAQITTRCWNVLNDAGATRWLQPEMTDWINDAMREIVNVDPDANSKLANVTLAAGTKQVLPAGAIALGKLVRNMGVGGATPGEAPRPVAIKLMDLHRPTWHADTATLVVKNYMPDPRTPRNFYVWPPMSGATVVECEYSTLPTPVVNPSDSITLDDFYVNAIVDYVLYRAFSKDIELLNSKTKAATHKAAFDQSMAVASKAEEEEEA